MGLIKDGREGGGGQLGSRPRSASPAAAMGRAGPGGGTRAPPGRTGATAPGLTRGAAGRAPGAPSLGTADKIAQLKSLGELRDGGVLTDAEFESEKRKLLGG